MSATRLDHDRGLSMGKLIPLTVENPFRLRPGRCCSTDPSRRGEAPISTSFLWRGFFKEEVMDPRNYFPEPGQLRWIYQPLMGMSVETKTSRRSFSQVLHGKWRGFIPNHLFEYLWRETRLNLQNAGLTPLVLEVNATTSPTTRRNSGPIRDRPANWKTNSLVAPGLKWSQGDYNLLQAEYSRALQHHCPRLG